MRHKLCLAIATLLAACFARGALAAPKYEIKFAVLAPEGSTWVNVLRTIDQDLQSKTGGDVALKIYPGGVSGDEKDVLRKIRIGQLNAGGFTGIGLGSIVPSVRIFELPLLFRNYAEVDALATALRPEMEKEFATKGFVLLGWAEVGFANLLTQKPVTKREDLQGTKMWAWEGDELAKTMYEAIGVVPVYLALPDVLVSLQTGMIEGVYNSPLGTVALQWFTKTKAMTQDPLAYGSGAVIVSKKSFDALPAAYQTIVRSVFEKRAKELMGLTRKENDEAVLALKQNGIKMVNLTAEARAELETLSKTVHQKLVGKLYPQELLDKVYKILAALRT